MLVEYKAKITGDISSLEKAINKAQGKVRELEDNEILIKLNYDGNLKDYNKVIDEMQKLNPTLAVQFEYELNKKALANELAKLSDITINIDNGDAEKKIKALEKQIIQAHNALSLINPDDDAALEKHENKINELVQQMLDYKAILYSKGEKGKNIFNSLSNELHHIIETVSEMNGLSPTINMDNVDNQIQETQKKIDYFTNNIERLKKLGAIDTGTSTNSHFNVDKKEISASSKALEQLIQDFSTYAKEHDNLNLSSFWDELQAKVYKNDEAVLKLLSDLQMLDENDDITIVDEGMVKSGGLIGQANVLLASKNENNRLDETIQLKEKLDEAAEAGINVARILDIIPDKEKNVFFELQELAPGKMLGSYTDENIVADFFKATDEQIVKLISDIKSLNDMGIGADLNLSNIFFDEKKGFSLIDLDLKPANYLNFKEMIDDLVGGIVGSIESFDNYTNFDGLENFRQRIESVTEDVIKLAKKSITLSDDVEKAAEDAGAEAGKAVTRGLRKGIDAHSNSKEAENATDDFINGIVDEVDQRIGDIESAGKKAGNALSESFDNTINKTNDESSISSGSNPIIEEQNRLQQELQETQEEANKTEKSLKEIYRAFNSEHGILGKDISWFSDSLESVGTYFNNGNTNKDKLAKLLTDTSKFLSVDANGGHWGEISYNGKIYSADELAELAKNLGYVGIEIKNVYDAYNGINSGIKSTTFAIFDESIVNNAEDATNELKEKIETFDKLYDYVQEALYKFDGQSSKTYNKAVEEFSAIEDEYKKGLLSIEDAYNKIDIVREKLLKADEAPVSKIGVKDFYEKYGTPSNALDQDYWARMSEVIDELGGKFKELNNESDILSEKKIDSAFLKELIEELDLAEDSATVIKSLFHDIDFTFSEQGQSLYGGKTLSVATDKIEKIKDIISGKHIVTDDEIKKAEELLNIIKESQGNNVIDSSELDKANQEIEELKNNLKASEERADSLEHSLENTTSELNITNEKLSETEAALEQAKDDADKFEQSLYESESAAEKLNEELEKAKQTNESLSEEAAYQRERASDNFSQFYDESKRADQLEEENNALKEQLKNNEAITAELKEQAEQREKDIKRSNESKELNDLEEALTRVTKKVDDKTKAFQNEAKVVAGITKNEADNLKKVEDKVESITDKANSIKPKKDKKGNKSKDSSSTSKKTPKSDVEKNLDNIRKGYDDIRISIERLMNDTNRPLAPEGLEKAQQRLNEIKAQIKYIDNNKINIIDNNEATDEIGKLEKALNLAKNYSDEIKQQDRISKDNNRTKWAERIADVLSKNTKYSKAARQELKSYYDLLTSGATVSDQKLRQIANRFNEIQAEEKLAGNAGKTFFDQATQRLQDMNSKFLAQFFSWQDMIRYVRETAQAVVELDSALTELRKVSDASTERLAQSFETSAQTAKDLGSTISDVINVTADWSRLGYNVDEAEELARVTTLFKTVGDNMTAESASEAMISTLKGYELTVDEAERIVDRYNSVAKVNGQII